MSRRMLIAAAAALALATAAVAAQQHATPRPGKPAAKAAACPMAGHAKAGSPMAGHTKAGSPKAGQPGGGCPMMGGHGAGVPGKDAQGCGGNCMMAAAMGPHAKAGGLVCPVMKNPIASPAKASGKSVYKGKTYYFCCAGCKPAFDKEPTKYVCPVSGTVLPKQPTVKSTYKGKTYFLCCAGCKPKFEKSPAKYVARR